MEEKVSSVRLYNDNSSNEGQSEQLIDIEEVIKQIKDVSDKILNKYSIIIRYYKSLRKPIYSPLIGLVSFFAFTVKNMTEESKKHILLKVNNLSELEKEIEKSAKESLKQVFDRFEFVSKDKEIKLLKIRDDQSTAELYNEVLKKLNITFNAQKDLDVCIDVVNYISLYRVKKNIKSTSELIILSLLHDLLEDERFVSMLTTNYLKAIVQTAVRRMLRFSKIKKFFKSPLQAIKELKDTVVNTYNNLSGTGKFITVVAIVVLITIAIKKLPVLKKFFGKVWKFLLLPFNKIVSFFKKIPALFESYLSNQVSRRLIEMKMKEMDMYATMYLLV